MCAAFGFSPDILPEIHACHDIIGTVTEEAAAQCGLAPGTPVAAGGLDAACGTLGAGVIHSGETQEQGGQAGGMSICTDTYQADERLIPGISRDFRTLAPAGRYDWRRRSNALAGKRVRCL